MQRTLWKAEKQEQLALLSCLSVVILREVLIVFSPSMHSVFSVMVVGCLCECVRAPSPGLATGCLSPGVWEAYHGPGQHQPPVSRPALCPSG